jgi:hypothetical protein
MTKRLWILGLGLAACGLAVVLSATAAPPRPKEEDHSAENAQLVSLALGLADHGRHAHFPEDLLVAARILRTIPVGSGDTLKNAVIAEEGENGTAQPKKEKPETVGFKAEADDLTNEGLKMAKELLTDKKLTEKEYDEVVALAERARNPGGTRGAVGGPQFVSMNIKPGWRDYWKIQFKGGQRAAITVSNDKNQPLYVRVANNDNQTVAEESGTFVQLSWYPESTKQFTIHVTHKGRQPCIYKVVSN